MFCEYYVYCFIQISLNYNVTFILLCVLPQSRNRDLGVDSGMLYQFLFGICLPRHLAMRKELFIRNATIWYITTLHTDTGIYVPLHWPFNLSHHASSRVLKKECEYCALQQLYLPLNFQRCLLNVHYKYFI